MPLFTDQTGRTTSIPHPPSRIVSLVPSQTELLFDLALDATVVGITKFCIHPETWFRSRTRVGGTKKVHFDIINKLHPDLILANKEENTREEIEKLTMTYPVWISDISTLDDACDMIRSISTITATSVKGASIINNIITAFETLKKPVNKPRVCYLIWRDPYMTTGHDTFIHDMLHRCGFENVFAGRTRYPIVSLDEIAAASCDYVFLSSEPYPFTDKHALELKIGLKDNKPGKFILVDGEYFSWYGSRLMSAAFYFQTLIDKLQDGAATNR
jgi:ABC-type Fe3+-hydroxamate transport system substrate-binding protein